MKVGNLYFNFSIKNINYTLFEKTASQAIKVYVF